MPSKRRFREIQRMAATLYDFEEQYGMDSEEFAERFERGQLPKLHDFVDWYTTWISYSIYRNKYVSQKGDIIIIKGKVEND